MNGQSTIAVGVRPRAPRGRPRFPISCSASCLALLVGEQELYSFGPSLLAVDWLSWGLGSLLFILLSRNDDHARRTVSLAGALLNGAFRLYCSYARAPCALGAFVGPPARQVARSALTSFSSPGPASHLVSCVVGGWAGCPWAPGDSQAFGQAEVFPVCDWWAGGKRAPCVGGLGPLSAGAGGGASGGRPSPTGVSSGALCVGYAVAGPKLVLLALSLDTGALCGYPLTFDAFDGGSSFRLSFARGTCGWITLRASQPPVEDPLLWFRSRVYPASLPVTHPECNFGPADGGEAGTETRPPRQALVGPPETPAAPLRKSSRGSRAGYIPILERAISLRLRLDEGPVSFPGTRSASGSLGSTPAAQPDDALVLKRLQVKSAKCGVLLGDADARSLNDFLCSSS